MAVIGAGSWGTTVAHLCAHNSEVVLYARDERVASIINKHSQNNRYLPDFELHSSLRATADIAEAVVGVDAVVMGVPSHGFRSTLELLRPHISDRVPVVSLTKGLERDTNKRMSEVIAELLPGRPVGVLTGPNLAREILGGQAAAAVLAMDPEHQTVAEGLRDVMCIRDFRVYTNSDVVGSEIAGATKNVIALAAGIADGLQAGDNLMAALITRGLSEVTRLGVAMGGHPMTFAGLAGIGDIVVTCVSKKSRNRHVGERLGRGEHIDDIVASMDQVAEGVKTVPVVVALARSLGVDMPIASEVRAVVEDGRPARQAYRALLDRPPTCEYRR